MAKLIEFARPQGYTPKTQKYVPIAARGKLLEFKPRIVQWPFVSWPSDNIKTGDNAK